MSNYDYDFSTQNSTNGTIEYAIPDDVFETNHRFSLAVPDSAATAVGGALADRSGSFVKIERHLVDNMSRNDKDYMHKYIFYVYRRRYAVAALYVLTVVYQLHVLTTFSPLAIGTITRRYNNHSNPVSNDERKFVEEDTTNLMIIYFASVFFLAIPGTFLVKKYSARKCLVASNVVISISLTIRMLWCYLSSSPVSFRISVYFSHIINCLAAVISLCCPMILSLNWFPTHQRRGATGVFMLAPYGGLCLSYIITYIVYGCVDAAVSFNHYKNGAVAVMMSVQAAFGFIISVLLFFLFPASPSIPPSVLTTIQRQSVRTSIREIVQKYRFWSTLATAALVVGSFYFYLYELAWVFYDFKFTLEATWAPIVNGFISIGAALAGIAMGTVISKLSDRLFSLFYLIAGLLLALDVFFGIATACSLDERVPDAKAATVLAVFSSLSIILAETLSPLLAEFLADFCFPVPEEVTFSFFLAATYFTPLGLLSYFSISGNYKTFSEVTVVFIAICLLISTCLLPILSRTSNKRKRLEREFRPQENVLEPIVTITNIQ